MDWSKLKEGRARSVKMMQDVLDQTEPLGLNAKLVFFLGLPVVFWQVLKVAVGMALAFMLGVVVKMAEIVFMPFVMLYVLIDITCISFWYLKEIAIRTSEDN